MLWNIKVFGIVQGVGFRPFVSRLAEAFSICGSVANRGSYVANSVAMIKLLKRLHGALEETKLQNQ